MAIDLGPLKKIVVPSADPVVAAAALSEEAQALARPGMPVKALLVTLLDAELWTDALRVFAYALPKREAVWWACQCARQAVPKSRRRSTPRSSRPPRPGFTGPTSRGGARRWTWR